MATAINEHVPPLAAGDHLTRNEFLRRWAADPAIKFAELIRNVVYMSSPVFVDRGGVENEARLVRADLGAWLDLYCAFTAGTTSQRHLTSFILEDTPQPDLNLRLLPEYGGSSWLDGGYLHGVPEFLAEVSASSASNDLHDKFDLYQSAGVQEYPVAMLFDEEIRWHELVDGRYRVLPPDADGLWRSRVFPGLWLDGNALLSGNLQRVLDRLQDGLRSPEHSDFVAQLAVRRQAGR